MNDWTTIARQDNAGTAGAPLGIFRNSSLIRIVPTTDPDGSATRNQVATLFGRPESEYEVLLTCPRHPQSSAVDCLDCEPV